MSQKPGAVPGPRRVLDVNYLLISKRLRIYPVPLRAALTARHAPLEKAAEGHIAITTHEAPGGIWPLRVPCGQGLSMAFMGLFLQKNNKISIWDSVGIKTNVI